MMTQPDPIFIVTANALIEGDVIYWSDTGWTRLLSQARAYHDKSEAEAQAAAALPSQAVGCYVTPMHLTPNGPQPLHFREVFRLSGPTHTQPGRKSAA